MSLLLRPLRADDEIPVRAGHEALAAENFGFALGLSAETAWSDYVAETARTRRADELAPGRVPATFLLAEVDGVVVGRSSIRHELNDWLLARGGHIGYAVLPAHRRRGYAGQILRHSLVIARSYGVRAALLTVDEDNRASRSVIESAGGRRDPVWPSDELDGHPIRRYWIPVP